MSSAVHPFQEHQAPGEGVSSPSPPGNDNPQPVSGGPAGYYGGVVPPETGGYVYGAPHPGGYIDGAPTYPASVVPGYQGGTPGPNSAGHPVGGPNSAGYPVAPPSNSVDAPSSLSPPLRASGDPAGSPENPVNVYGAPRPSGYLGGAPAYLDDGAPDHPGGAPDHPADVQNNAIHLAEPSGGSNSAGPPVGASGDPIEAPVTQNVAVYPPVQAPSSDSTGALDNAVRGAPSSSSLQ